MKLWGIVKHALKDSVGTQVLMRLRVSLEKSGQGGMSVPEARIYGRATHFLVGDQDLNPRATNRGQAQDAPNFFLSNRNCTEKILEE